MTWDEEDRDAAVRAILPATWKVRFDWRVALPRLSTWSLGVTAGSTPRRWSAIRPYEGECPTQAPQSENCRVRWIPCHPASGGSEPGAGGVADDCARMGVVGFGSCFECCLELG
jgi:hypothetical protein